MPRKSLVLLVGLAALWGLSYLCIKVSLDDLEPGMIAFVRVLLGAIVLWPLAWRAGALAGLGSRKRVLAITGVIQIAVPLLLIAVGQQWITSSLAGLLNGSVPIFLAVFALWLDPSESAAGSRIGGIVLGFVGVALVVGLDIGLDDGWALLGAACLLLSSIGYAVGPLYAKPRLGGLAPLGIAASLLTTSAIVLLPVAVAEPPDAVPAAETFLAMAVMGFGGTGIAFAMYYTLMQAVGPGRASVVAYLVPGFAVLYGALLLDEPLGPGAIVGLALILLGSWIAGGRRRQPPPVAEPDGATTLSVP